MSELNDGVIDDYGEKSFRIEQEGVLEAIRDNNPDVTSVIVEFEGFWDDGEEDDDGVDWVAAGRHIGASKHLEHLALNFNEPVNTYKFSLLCKGGLCENQSIKSLEIDMDAEVEEDAMSMGAEGVFDCLSPLFQRSTSIIAVDFTIPSLGPPSTASAFVHSPGYHHDSICYKIEVCSSLRSIKITGAGSLVKDYTAVIRKNPRLNRLSFCDGYLSTEACADIKNMLTSGAFELKSLSLSDFSVDEAGFPQITKGLAQTTTLKSLKIREFGHEKTQFSFDRLPEQMPTLDSLTLSSSSLPEMKDSNESTKRVATFFARNPSLKEFQLLNGYDFPSHWWCGLLSCIQTTTLESIRLDRIIPDESVVKALSKWLALNQSLKTLKISFCETVTPETWRVLSEALESHQSLENLDIMQEEDGGEVTGVFTNVVGMNSRLKRLSLPVNDMSQLRVVAANLIRPSCCIEELNLTMPGRNGLQHDLDREVIRILRNTTRLKAFRFASRSFDPSEEFWSGVSKLLCDKSSIEETYNSNHMLEVLSTRSSSPIQIYSMLQLNKVANKQAVAREKILQHHDLTLIDFASPVIPAALSCIGVSNSKQRLSQIYGIVRKVPHIVPSGRQKKRKSRELE